MLYVELDSKMKLGDIITGIQEDDPEAFLGAGELLRANAIGLNETGVIEPYQSMYRQAPLSQKQVDELSAILKNYIASGHRKNAASAANALGESRNPSLLPWLRTILRQSVQDFTRQGDLMGHLISAIDNCGDRVSTGTSFASDEYEKNLSDSLVYLGVRGLSGETDV